MRGGRISESRRPVDEDGSVSAWRARMHAIERGRSRGEIQLRSGSGMRGESGGVVLRGTESTSAEDGLRFVWRVSSGDMQWLRRPVPCPLRLAEH